MMATPMGSILYLTKSGGLDNSYTDTYYFGTSEEKFNFFTKSAISRKFDYRSFQRYARNVLTVQIPFVEAERYDYLLFKNSTFYPNHTDKPFANYTYAFISGYEYVSDTVTRITYNVDVIQTYFMIGSDEGIVTPLPCFIERQHTVDDIKYAHLEPENLAIGDYVTTFQDDFACADNDFSILIAYQDTIEIDVPEGLLIDEGMYGKTYSGVKYLHIPCTPNNIDLADNVIAALKVATFNNVISISMFPTAWIAQYQESTYHPAVSYRTVGIPEPFDVDGYVPKNNKLFNYPFCAWNISGGGSSGKDFAFEYSQILNGYATMRIDCPLSASGNLIAYPIFYMNKNQPVEYAVQSAPFPFCPVVSDKFTSWFSNNSLSIIGNCISSLAGMTMGGAGVSEKDVRNYMESHPRVEQAQELINDPSVPTRVKDMIETSEAGRRGMLDAYRNSVGSTPNYTSTANLINATLHGIQHANSSQTGQGQALFSSPHGSGIVVSVRTIRAHTAKIIDDYFTMYGYAINAIGTPNLHARKKFTYIKTRGFKFYGTVPATARDLIIKIHDNGIRYWVPSDNWIFGDFSGKNAVLTDD